MDRGRATADAETPPVAARRAVYLVDGLACARARAQGGAIYSTSRARAAREYFCASMRNNTVEWTRMAYIYVGTERGPRVRFKDRGYAGGRKKKGKKKAANDLISVASARYPLRGSEPTPSDGDAILPRQRIRAAAAADDASERASERAAAAAAALCVFNPCVYTPIVARGIDTKRVEFSITPSSRCRGKGDTGELYLARNIFIEPVDRDPDYRHLD